jgi:hypothetical protein
VTLPTAFHNDAAVALVVLMMVIGRRPITVCRRLL